MRPIQVTLSFGTADADGIALGQTPTTTVALTLNGTYASAGVATLPAPAKVTITSSDDMSGTVFTVVGTDANGLPISEVIAGPNNDTTTGLLDFKRVTSITPVGGVYTTEEITVGAADAGLGPTDWWPLDIYNPNQVTTISANLLSGTANYDVQFTNEDPFDTTITQLVKAHPVAAFTGATASQTESTAVLMRAVRIDINSGAGSLRVTVTQQSTA